MVFTRDPAHVFVECLTCTLFAIQLGRADAESTAAAANSQRVLQIPVDVNLFIYPDKSVGQRGASLIVRFVNVRVCIVCITLSVSQRLVMRGAHRRLGGLAGRLFRADGLSENHDRSGIHSRVSNILHPCGVPEILASDEFVRKSTVSISPNNLINHYQ